MKQIIILIAIIVLLIAIISIVVIRNKSKDLDEGVINNSMDNNIVVENNDSNETKSLLERRKPYDDYIYGLIGLEYEDNFFVSNGTLSRSGDKYNLELIISGPELYSEETVENAIKELNTKDKVTLGKYTFYKDFLHSADVDSNATWVMGTIKERIESYGNNGYIADGKYLFEKHGNDYLIYDLLEVWAGFGDRLVTEEKEKINVEILGSDIIETNINSTGADKGNISLSTVEEYMVGRDIASLGDSLDEYGGVQNAVCFDTDKIVVNITTGGV